MTNNPAVFRETWLAQYVCGLEPTSSTWKTFQVKPQLGNPECAETGNGTAAAKRPAQGGQYLPSSEKLF